MVSRDFGIPSPTNCFTLVKSLKLWCKSFSRLSSLGKFAPVEDNPIISSMFYVISKTQDLRRTTFVRLGFSGSSINSIILWGVVEKGLLHESINEVTWRGQRSCDDSITQYSKARQWVTLSKFVWGD